MAKTARSELDDQVELIRREAYETGYVAAREAIYCTICADLDTRGRFTGR